MNANMKKFVSKVFVLCDKTLSRSERTHTQKQYLAGTNAVVVAYSIKVQRKLIKKLKSSPYYTGYNN